ncbi:MAG: hypothetical protein J0H34_21090 [Rhizobiales bacterium]|nr:hypothetical protein [Hyphomicrobiales bacterium]
MTKNIGADYDRREKKQKEGSAGWLFSLLFPLVVVGVALLVAHYGGAFI